MTTKKETYADKPWLKSYKFGPYPLEKTITIPVMPIYKLLDDAADNYPDHGAVQFRGKQLTYSELRLYAYKLATALADLGVKKGDRVAVMVPNCPQMMIGEFGIQRCGGVYMAISALAKPIELEYQLTESGAEVIITTEELYELIKPMREKTKLREIILTSLDDFGPEPPPIKKVPGTRSLRELLDKYEANPPEIEIDPMEDLSTLFFTGGATGSPKGVMRTHYNDVAFAVSGFPWLMKPLERGAKGKSSLLVPLPLYHGAGNQMVLQCVAWGLRLILLPDPRDTDALVDAIHEYRPLIVVSAPTQLMRAVQKKVGRTASLVAAGTAPLPEEISKLWKKETGMPVTQSYALTEVGILFNLTAFSKLTGFMLSEKNALGVPCPNLEAKIVSEVTGEDVPFGEIGEIWLRGPTCMKGYWPTPGSGLKDGWVATGDVGRMDNDGYFYLEDRIKDMVNVSGLKVYTVNVDEVLFKHPGVAMAVAIGIPDPERPGSERIKAFIQLKDAYKGKVTAEEIIAHCRAHLPPYAAPRFVEFRDELPLTTASEKLFKRALRDEEVAKMKARGEIK